MKDKKNTTNSNETSDSNETSENNNNFEQLIKQQDIDLANLEKIDLFFLLYGYSIFVVGANLDILDAQDRNNTGETSEEAFLFSQRLVLLGYTLLWIVSLQRIYVKNLSNTYRGEDNDIIAFQKVADSYLISIFANTMRLQAFDKLNIDEIQSKREDNDKKNNS